MQHNLSHATQLCQDFLTNETNICVLQGRNDENETWELHLLFFILNETLSIDREIKLQSFNMNQVVEGVKCKSARAKKCKVTPI